MEKSVQEDCLSNVQIFVKSEPCDMVNEEIYIKSEDITESSVMVHIKQEMNDFMLSSEKDISDEIKLEPIDSSEYNNKDEVDNHTQDGDAFKENSVEDDGSCYKESFNSFKFTTYSKWDNPDTPKKVIELSYQETIQLIELYASEKILYDINYKEYNNKALRDSAYERIANALKIPGLGPEEVMQGLRKLRTTYYTENKKIANKKMRGEVYESTFSWFKHMDSFFRPFIRVRRYKQPIQQLQTARKKDSFVEQVKTQSHIERKDIEKRIAIVEQRIQSSSLNMKIIGSEKFSASNVKLRKPDCFDHFGSYVASLFRSTEPVVAMRLQRKITSCISKALYPTLSSNSVD